MKNYTHHNYEGIDLYTRDIFSAREGRTLFSRAVVVLVGLTILLVVLENYGLVDRFIDSFTN